MKNFLSFAILLFMTMSVTANAEPIDAPHKHVSEGDRLLHDAGHAIDGAWDAFHKAALGGTLASPDVQSSVERDLMTSRQLLREARKAQHQGEMEEVKRITTQIGQISQEIVKQSQREKE